MVLRLVFALGLALGVVPVHAENLTPDRLGIVYANGNLASVRIAKYYAAERGVPAANLVGLSIPDKPVIGRDELRQLRSALLDKLPSSVQSLLLVWSRPYAVECMSITTAFAAGYQAAFCEPGGGLTATNPLFATQGWLPADTTGWLPAMLLPSGDETLAREVIDRGARADDSHPPGTIYLVRTQDTSRNVRAAGYIGTETLVGNRVRILEETTPIHETLRGAIAYFTGAARAEELNRIE